MKKENIRLFIDRMGVRYDKCYPLYDKLIERYGKNNIFAMTEKQDVIDRYGDKVSKLINVKAMYGTTHDDIRYSRAQQSPTLDAKTLEVMSKYQHLIMLALDRQVRGETYLYMTNCYFDYLAYWNGFLIENKINVAFFENPPHEFHDMLIYCLCKHKGIKTIMISHVYNGYYILTDDIHKYSIHPIWEGEIEYNGMSELNESFQELVNRYTDFDKIPTPESKPNYYKETGVLKEIDADKLRLLRRIGYSCLYAMQVIFQWKNSRFIRFLFRQQQRDYLNTFGEARRFYDQVAINPNYNCNYVYVALHYQPEMTTLTYGGYYENQILMIRLLSCALPDNYALYVKEHPRMFVDYVRYPYSRDIRYYKELVSIKNVKLIKKEASTYDLMQNSAFVATVTGTVGIEALFRGKQVLHFGRAPFEGAPGSHKVSSLKDCKKIIERVLSERENNSIGNDKMNEWLLRLQNRCVYGGIDRNFDEKVKLYRDNPAEKQKFMLEFLIEELED